MQEDTKLQDCDTNNLRRGRIADRVRVMVMAMPTSLDVRMGVRESLASVPVLV